MGIELHQVDGKYFAMLTPRFKGHKPLCLTECGDQLLRIGFGPDFVYLYRAEWGALLPLLQRFVDTGSIAEQKVTER